MTDLNPGTWVASDEDGHIVAAHQRQPAMINQLRRLAAIDEDFDITQVAIEQIGYGFPLGARVHLTGDETTVISDDRWVDNGSGLLVRNPGGSRVVEGIHSPDGPRYGVVVGHEPSVATQEHPKHLVRMDNGTELSVDYHDLEAAG